MVKAGLDEGRFLVRTRDNKPGEYVLCVVYKGKPTHHLIAKNEAGIYAINKKTFGEYNKVNRVSHRPSHHPTPNIALCMLTKYLQASFHAHDWSGMSPRVACVTCLCHARVQWHK